MIAITILFNGTLKASFVAAESKLEHEQQQCEQREQQWQQLVQCCSVEQQCKYNGAAAGQRQGAPSWPIPEAARQSGCCPLEPQQ